MFGSELISGLIPRISIRDIVEIILLTFMTYYVIKNLKNTRAWLLIKGVIVLAIMYIVAYLLEFSVILVIFQNLVLFFGIAIIVIIQPELRKIIESIGQRDINVSFNRIVKLILRGGQQKVDIAKYISDKTIQEIVRGCAIMSKAKTGALIVIEIDTPLNEYIESGIAVNADITSQLLINIFEKNTPLHDGAVIIQNDKIVAATCYLPLSESKNINKELGTRHRAAIGITEQTDAVVVTVSEETGDISIAKNGQIIRKLDREKLVEQLKMVQQKKTVKKQISIRNTKHLNIKIACMVSSILLWILVMGTVNPIDTRTITNIPIQVINEDAITSTGKTYDIVSGDTVNISIRDKKSNIDSISTDDIVVTADLSKLSITNAVLLDVDILKYPDMEYTLNNNVINITIEDVVNTEIDIEANIFGESPESYYLNNVEISNKSLVVSGAKSTVDTIGKVVIDIDKSNIDKAGVLENSYEPKIYDKNGDLIDKSKLHLNLDTIEAKLEVYNTKVIPLNIDVKLDNLLVKSVISNIGCNVDSIQVAGEDSVLSKYNELNLEIPLSINLNDVTESQFNKSIQISEFLPNDLKVDNNTRVNIELQFLDFNYKKIEFDSTDIDVIDIHKDKSYTIEDKKYEINLIGINDSIDSANIKTLSPYVDISELSDGEYLIALNFKYLGSYVYGDTAVAINVVNNANATKE